MSYGKTAATVLVLLSMAGVIHIGRLLTGPGGIRAPRPAATTQKLPAKAMGLPEASVKIMEYTDFQCPACAAGAQAVKEILDRYPGQVYLEYHHYPLSSIHPRASRIAVDAECAARQGRFWPYHDLLFQFRQQLMTYSDFEQKLGELAVLAGIDQGMLKVCSDEKSAEDAVEKERQEGLSRGVRATPTYFVNGEMVVGAQSIKEQLIKLLTDPQRPGGMSR